MNDMKTRIYKPKVQLILHVLYRGMVSERVFVQPATPSKKG